MNPSTIHDVDDVATAIHENRPLQLARAYRIAVAIDGVAFREVLVGDAHPLGREIVGTAGLDPHSDPSLFALLPSGDFDEVVLDQPVDLRARGTERFIVFTTDRDFKFTLNGAQGRWFQRRITGEALCVLANAVDEEVAYQLVGDERRVIDRDAEADLGDTGVEHFVVGPREGFDIIINGREVHVERRRQTFEDFVRIAFPDGQAGQNISYSITFRRADSQPHEGELGAGGFIDVRNGTIVNVTRTVQS
jgi:hypothetical protein